MRKNNPFLLWIIFFAILFSLYPSVFLKVIFAQDIPVLLQKKVDNPIVQKFSEDQGEKIHVHVDFSLIRPSPDSAVAIQASLPGKDIILTKKRMEERLAGSYTWFGKVEGRDLSTAVMTVVDGVLYGHIDVDGESYSISPVDGDYLVTKQDQSKRIPFEDDAKIPEKKTFNYAVPQSQLQEDGSVIDVLVLYTLQMQNKYGANLNAMIQNFFDLANSAYNSSGINTRLRLIQSELFNDSNAAEGVSISNALNYITNNSSLSAKRDSYNADLVSLLRIYSGSASSCGIAWQMQSVDQSFSDYAFSVVEVRPAAEANPYYCDSRAFAHEIGHNLGCSHDRDHANMSGAYPYSYGYDIPGVFGTIMSYDGPTITYFSTPLINYSGYPIGKNINDPNAAYNAMTINNTRVTVANFRVSSSANQTIMDLVTKYYQDILGRAPEPGGAEWWTQEIERIISIGVDVKEGFQALAKQFFNCKEYQDKNQTDVAFVTDLYQTFLQRPPNSSEVSYWVDYLAQGLTRNMLITQFAYCEEFRLFIEGIFGTATTRPENNLVNDLYRGFLNRFPDTAGYNGWVGLMRDAQCTGEQAVRNLTYQIALGFTQSQEYGLRNRNNWQYIEDLYNGILRRGADPAGFMNWVNPLTDGTYTREQVLQSFVNSPEFQLRVQEVIDAGCLP